MDKSKGQRERHMPDRIKAIRLQNGPRSQRQFARDLGVFQQNVNRYELGTTPCVEFLHTVALKEKVSLDWLVYGYGHMARPLVRRARK